MKFIAHRGNISGININKENTIDYIISALNQDFEVEIDLWYENGIYYLGHDEPKNKISLSFIGLTAEYLWCHAKTVDTLNELLKYPNINCFFHQTDDVTLTSHKYMWTFPEKPLSERSILLKFVKDEKYIIPINIVGICSDNIDFYRKKFNI